MFGIAVNDLSGKKYAVVKPDDMTTLKFMQTIVEGLITLVPTEDENIDLFVNDEGLYFEHFVLNPVASRFAGQPLVGPSIMMRHNRAGETTSMTVDDMKAFGCNEFIGLELWLALRKLSMVEIGIDEDLHI